MYIYVYIPTPKKEKLYWDIHGWHGTIWGLPSNGWPVGPLVTWNSIHRKFDAIRIQAKIWSNLVLKKLSWQHIQAGHFPFRKDCRTCQEACAKEKASSLPWINSEVEAGTRTVKGLDLQEEGTRTVKGLDLSKGPKFQPHIISCWRLEEYNKKNFEGRIGSGAVAPWWHPCPTIGPAYVQSLRTSQGGFRKLHVPTQAHHDAFLHTTALMSGPLR